MLVKGELAALADPGRHAPATAGKLEPRPRGAGLYIDRLTMRFTSATTAPKRQVALTADRSSFANP